MAGFEAEPLDDFLGFTGLEQCLLFQAKLFRSHLAHGVGINPIEPLLVIRHLLLQRDVVGAEFIDALVGFAVEEPRAVAFDVMGGNIGRDLGLGGEFLFEWHRLGLVLRLNP